MKKMSGNIHGDFLKGEDKDTEGKYSESVEAAHANLYAWEGKGLPQTPGTFAH